jgi:hypothetical protein
MLADQEAQSFSTQIGDSKLFRILIGRMGEGG